MASLYEDGWRQGSILEATLPLDAVILGPTGYAERRQGEHGRWVVATQDCDLDQTDRANAEPTVELRPVFLDGPPADWGIRSAQFLVAEGEYVRSASPRTFVSAALLAALVTSDDGRRRDGDPVRRQAFTTWLGLRYDRPAVPPTVLPLAKRIAEEVTRRRHRPVGRRTRDVLMQFDEGASPTRFSLFAVLAHEDDEQEVREWLAGIAQAIPATFGLADQIEAATAAGISLQLIETSYAADVSSLTWRPVDPRADGVT
jgi:hypothetical protein